MRLNSQIMYFWVDNWNCGLENFDPVMVLVEVEKKRRTRRERGYGGL